MDLAKQIVDAYWNFDPFNGADYDEVLEITKQDVKTIEGCHEIIRELVELLNESLK